MLNLTEAGNALRNSGSEHLPASPSFRIVQVKAYRIVVSAKWQGAVRQEWHSDRIYATEAEAEREARDLMTCEDDEGGV